MGKPLNGGLAQALDLTDGYIVRFVALDPTTGAVNSSVNVSNASLLVDNMGGGDLTSGFEDIQPLWVPLPNNLFNSGSSG